MKKVLNETWGLILVGVVLAVLFMLFRAGEEGLWPVSLIAAVSFCGVAEVCNMVFFDNHFKWKRVAVSGGAAVLTILLMLLF